MNMAYSALIYLQQYVKFEAARLASTFRLRVGYSLQLSGIYCSCSFQNFDANFAQHVPKAICFYVFKFGMILVE